MIEHPKLWAHARRSVAAETRLECGSRGSAGVRSFLPPIVQIGLAALAGWAVVGLLFLSVVVLIEVLS